jgi:hypothetical protein
MKETQKNLWLQKIEDERYHELLECFFEPSIIKNFKETDLQNLINALNEDIKNKVYTFKTKYYKDDSEEATTNARNTMTPEQINSKSHQLFLKTIKKYFGDKGYKLLKERKNINIFNLKEIHVLNKKIFNNLGEKFVNSILNYEIEGALVTIPNLINDKNKMANFKYFYKNFGDFIMEKPSHFNKIFNIFNNYEHLIEDMRTKKTKISKKRMLVLKEIFYDQDNTYNINSVSDLNSYHDLKRQKNNLDISRAIKNKDLDLLKKIIYKGIFSMNYHPKEKWPSFDNDITNARHVLDNYNLEKFASDGNKYLSKKEKSLLKDLIALDSANFDDALSIFNKYKDAKNVGVSTLDTIKKIPASISQAFNETLTKIDSLSERCKSKEEGLSFSEVEDVPVYTFEGADFAFISSTCRGLSTNAFKKGNKAETWFEFENGMSHISCSYSTQDNLNCSMELKQKKSQEITLIFDEVDVLAMGTSDIGTPDKPRVAKLDAGHNVTFELPKEYIAKSVKGYNEVAINRYKTEGDSSIRYGGKIIPSAILCTNEISPQHIEAAKQFTEFLIKNNLKPIGYKMPIIVVKKEIYQEREKDKKAQMLSSVLPQKTVPHEKKEIEIKSPYKIEGLVARR